MSQPIFGGCALTQHPSVPRQGQQRRAAFNLILGPRCRRRLPRHVLRRINAATLQRYDVIDHVSRAGAGRLAGCRARVLMLESAPDSGIALDSASGVPLAIGAAYGRRTDVAALRRTT